MCIRDRIETILGALEMEEILYELREHSAGLNAGRWDYIFSCLLYTSDAADERSSVDLGGRRIIKKKKWVQTERIHSMWM